MKTITKYVIGTIIYMLAFITTMVVIFLFKGAIPDALVYCALPAGAVELVLSAILKVHGDNLPDDAAQSADGAFTDACIDDSDEEAKG